MRRALTAISNKCLNAEPGPISCCKVQPSAHIAAWRRWTHEVAGERRTVTPARLEGWGVEEAIADAARRWWGLQFFGPRTQAFDQIRDCLVARSEVETGMCEGNPQLALHESISKLFIHWRLGSDLGEFRLTILDGLVRAV